MIDASDVISETYLKLTRLCLMGEVANDNKCHVF